MIWGPAVAVPAIVLFITAAWYLSQMIYSSALKITPEYL